MADLTYLTDLTRPVAPNLPLAPAQYSPGYGEALNNVFRLYFNQLDATLQVLSNDVTAIDAALVSLQTQTTDNYNVLQNEIDVLNSTVSANQAQNQALIWLDM